MHSAFNKLIYIANQFCRILLPRGIYIRLRWVAKQRLLKALNEQGGMNEITFTNTDFITCDGKKLVSDSAGNYELEEFRQDCELVLCCAFLGRHQILRQIIIESFSSQNGDNIRWMLVGSSDEDFNFILSMAKLTGRVAGFLSNNSPLGKKWKTCLVHAGLYYNSDLYGITGSDDFLSSSLIDSLLSNYRSNVNNVSSKDIIPSLYAVKEWFVIIYKQNTSLMPRALLCEYNPKYAVQPLGAGRFYTQDFMKEVNFNIFDGDKERQLDDRGYNEIVDRKKITSYLPIEDGPLVSVKGNWAQLSTINDFLASLQLKITRTSSKEDDLIKHSMSDSTNKYLFNSTDIKN